MTQIATSDHEKARTNLDAAFRLKLSGDHAIGARDTIAKTR